MKLKDLMNYEIDKDKKSSIQIKAVKFLVGFLIIMFLLTIVSRAADSITITKVTVTQATGMAISHDIETDGTVSSVRDIAITTVPNVKIVTVNAAEGKTVEKGDLLFELDTDDIARQLKAARKDLASAKKDIADQKKAAQEAKDSAAEPKKRAYEDYNDSISSAKRTLKTAEDAMDSARKAYLKYKNKKNKTDGSSDSTVADSLAKTEEEKQSALDKAKSALEGLKSDIEADVQDAIKAASVDSSGKKTELSQEEKQAIRDKISSSSKNTALLKAAQEKISNAEDELASAKTAVDQYESEHEVIGKQGYKSQLKALRDDYLTKKSDYSAAVDQYNSTVKEAKRTLKDALSSGSGDTGETSADSGVSVSDDAATSDTDVSVSSTDDSSDDLASKQKAVDRLISLQKAKGKVTASSSGLITKVSAEVGDTTTEEAVARISDHESGYSFKGTLEKSSAKYLSKGDKVTLDFSNGVSVEGLRISDVEVSANDGDTYDVTVDIPSKVEKISTYATMKADKASKKYDTCVPLGCLHSDGNDYYVYTVSESSSVLGIENKVDKVSVAVIDKNTEYAAIDGTFNYDQQFVLTSTKTLNDKDRVRILQSEESETGYHGSGEE